MACLDTTVFLDLRGRGGKALAKRAANALQSIINAGEALTTTRFNLAELYVGIERSTHPDVERAVIAELLTTIVVLDFNDEAARYFGTVMAHLLNKGQPIADMDALIGSVALANDQRLLTRNVAHFDRIFGLTVQAY